MKKRIAIIGGGFFGMYIAEFFAKQGHDVQLFEKESSFMSRASFNNQARVHNGYHYPRSILTALRSRISFPRFVDEFRDCVDSDFEKYYLISSKLGKVTANQFAKFCETKKKSLTEVDKLINFQNKKLQRVSWKQF
jgi:monoamine oxidase